MDTFRNRFELLTTPRNLILILSLSVGSSLLIRAIGAASLSNFSFHSAPLQPLQDMFRNFFADEWIGQAWKVALGVIAAFWVFAGKQLRKAEFVLCAPPRRRRR
jgi:hypothetical protein